MPKSGRELSEQGFSAIAGRFKLLSDPIRLRILHELWKSRVSVGELATLTGTTQPNISKHLALLRAEGLVSRTKEGGSVFYAVADETVFQLCETVCDGLEERLKTEKQSLYRPSGRSRSKAAG